MSTPTLSLYRVTLRGFGGFTTSVNAKVSYVAATDPTAAYAAVRADLDKRDHGFARERELESVELLAATPEHNDTGTRLYLT